MLIKTNGTWKCYQLWMHLTHAQGLGQEFALGLLRK